MSRFASACLRSFKRMVKKLEVTLGPDTGDLNLRVGMHTGPVIAGVLRGDRARFQLFGDTMNTTSRLEATSRPGKIQVSKETAEALNAVGKGAWLRLREDGIHAKGKGQMRTFWLLVTNNPGSVNSVTETSIHDVGVDGIFRFKFSYSSFDRSK